MKLADCVLSVSMLWLLTAPPALSRDSVQEALCAFEDAGAAKIHKNYLAPPTADKNVPRMRALVLFRLQPDGQLTDIRAVRESGILKAIRLKKESDFLAVEKALVHAVKASSPLPKPPAELRLASVPQDLLYVFEPSKNPAGKLTMLALPMVPTKH